MTRDHRDLVIEALADSEFDLATEAAQVREALHVATELLRARDMELTALQRRHRELRDEFQALRARILHRQRAA